MKWQSITLAFFLMALVTSLAFAKKGGPILTTQPVEKAVLAGGCFWCMEPPYDHLKGIISTRVGYAGGQIQNPTYEQVSSGTTGHAEAIEITFNPSVISFKELLNVFWRNIDPTAVNHQFADYGSQYRTAIFYSGEKQRQAALQSKEALKKSGKFTRPIATEITELTVFYPAEDYHQKFYKKNPLRYGAYKKGSGREDYIQKTWKN